MKTRLFALLLCSALLGLASASKASGFDPGFADFSAAVKERSVDYELMSFSMMPGEATRIAIPEEHRDEGPVELNASGGRLEATGNWTWEWQAPETPGLQTLRLKREGQRGIQLNVFVLTPASRIENGYLDGYRMGRYPSRPLRGDPIYRKPSGFIRVDADMVDLPLSPHFTLGQFLCKQQPDHWPKYLLVRTDLLIKLEKILAEVNARGVRTDTFTVMSGYRTPWYNEAIGNGRYSRHVWGGAADIFIDTTGDGRMDDLTGDDRSDIRDAKWLRAIVNEMFHQPPHRRLVGGLGLYGPRPHRGPFVHVDVRGHEAHWDLP